MVMKNNKEKTQQKQIFTAFSAVTVVLLAVAWYALTNYQYPNQRVCHWFEFFTDGGAPDFLAEDCRRVLASLWYRIFDGGHIQSSGLLDAMVQEIGGNELQVDILELAAGSGVAAGLWHQSLSQQGLQVRTVLTDLQPMVASWEQVAQDFATANDNNNKNTTNLSHVPDSVDATDASAIVPKYFSDWPSATSTTSHDNTTKSHKEVRMIHLALHHFKPHLVKAIFQDAVKANAMIVVGDLVPSLPNIFLQSQWGFHEFLRLIPTFLIENPIKIAWAALTPFLILASYHDAAVSVMRSYSFEQLQTILEECTNAGQSNYKIRTFQLYTFADSLGLAEGTIPLFDSPHVQFFVASPTTTEN